MKIMVTGGAGFIGSHLAKRLLDVGHTVVVVDNLSTGRLVNIPEGAGFLKLDLTCPDFPSELPTDINVVCHLAAQSAGAVSAERPYYDLQANAASTLLLSRWCLEKGVRRFVYASSMAVYGKIDHSPVREETPCFPISYYGVTKLTAEHFLRMAEREGLKVTSFRIFTAYGPGQDLSNLRQGMVSIYLAYFLKGGAVPVTGSLDRFRDLIYIDDIVDAWQKAVEKPETSSQVYNLGSGRPTTVRELLASLKHALGLKPDYPVEELPGSPSDQFGLFADVSKLEGELECMARTKLVHGLRKMVAWVEQKKNPDSRLGLRNNHS